MRIRDLIDCELQISDKIKQSNGISIVTYQKIKDYKIALKELIDEVSASIYGANINKTYRICSPHAELEKFLSSKLNNTNDNISKYYILINEKRYKIISVKFKWVDIELI